MSQYCGLNSDISPRQPLDVVGQGTGRVKARKCGLRQRQFNGQSKSHACKKRKMRNSFTTCEGQAGIQPFPGKLGSITWSGDLGRQTPSLCMFPHSFLFPQLYMLTMVPNGTENPFGQLNSAVPSVSPPKFLCTSNSCDDRVGW